MFMASRPLAHAMPIVTRSVFLLLTTVAAGSALTGCKDDEAVQTEPALSLEQQLAEAATRVRDGQLDQAQARYDKLLESNPEDPRVLTGMANLRIKQGRADEAQALLEKAVAKPDAPAESFAALGALLTRKKDHEGAAEIYAKARAKDPDDSALGLAEGKALLAAGDAAKAEAVLKQVAKLDPKALDDDKVGVHTYIADALRAQDKGDEALRMYMKAQNTWASDRMARAGAAFIYEARNDWQHAIDEWSAYIRMDCCSDYSNEVAKKKLTELQAKAEAELPK